MVKDNKSLHIFPEVGSPFFWSLCAAKEVGNSLMKLEEKNLKFVEEVVKTQVVKGAPPWATPHKKRYALETFSLLDFSKKSSASHAPVLIVPPFAGHSSTIADFHHSQSLVETLLQEGLTRVFCLEWHSATPEMKDYTLDVYLAQLHVAISDLKEKVHLVGLCQGGWLISLYAARFPEHVASLVIAGSPIDTQAGSGVIKEYVNTLDIKFYEDLVASGGGLLKGAYMLDGFKSMHPEEHYVDKYIELYEHIDDPDYVTRTENFERWYEYTLNLPGRWYLQVVRELFKENKFARGEFEALGMPVRPASIVCPTYLLAGARDDITPQEQVFEAKNLFGTPKDKIVTDLAAGGHIGLFMGHGALTQNWPKIAAWLKSL